MSRYRPPEITVRFVRTAHLLSRSDAERYAARLLDESEMHVAERLSDRRIRSDYIAAHVLARLTLADATGAKPKSIQFRRTGIGRAEIAQPRWARDLHFSVSHANGVALCGVAVAPIGAGVECVAGRTDPRSPSLPLWAGIDAITRAGGRGIRVPIPDMHATGAFSAMRDATREWLVGSIWVTPQHLATIAVGAREGHDAQMTFQELF